MSRKIVKYKLLTDNINEIFDLFKPYVAQKPNNENIAQAIKVVDESIREMNIKDKTRLRKFCAIILEVSRCMNKRKAYTWIDYMRVRRYLWSLDRGISIDEMEKYWFIPKQTTTIETFSDALPQGDSFDIDENDI